MVRGLDRFRDHFQDHASNFAIIGGVAADAWLGQAGVPFRVTKDIDMVLLVEALNDTFLRQVWSFVKAGGYERKERSDGKPIYYRFTKPIDESYPSMLEIFSRAPDCFTVFEDQQNVPIRADGEASSLSAILMDDAYYRLVVDNRGSVAGLPCVTPACLILLKARAWLDLTTRHAAGEAIDQKAILKHRNDVFRLAMLLEGEPLPIPRTVSGDMGRFLEAFPAESPDWNAIEQASGLGQRWPSAEALLGVLRQQFGISPA